MTSAAVHACHHLVITSLYQADSRYVVTSKATSNERMRAALLRGALAPLLHCRSRIRRIRVGATASSVADSRLDDYTPFGSGRYVAGFPWFRGQFRSIYSNP